MKERNHAVVLFYDEQECDMCDERGIVAVISTLGKDCLCICLACLKKISTV